MPTREVVIQLVADALRKQVESHPDFGAEIKISERSIRREEDWWSVGIYPTRELRNRYFFYELLAEAEGELQDDLNLNIALVPVSPPEAAAA